MWPLNNLTNQKLRHPQGVSWMHTQQMIAQTRRYYLRYLIKMLIIF